MCVYADAGNFVHLCMCVYDLSMLQQLDRPSKQFAKRPLDLLIQGGHIKPKRLAKMWQ